MFLKVFIPLCFVFYFPGALGSSWDECSYKIKVKKTSKDTVTVEQVEFLNGDGMGGNPGEANCMLHLKEGSIPVEQIKKRKVKIRKNTFYKVTRRAYTATGPAGVVGGVNWKFQKIKIK